MAIQCLELSLCNPVVANIDKGDKDNVLWGGGGVVTSKPYAAKRGLDKARQV